MRRKAQPCLSLVLFLTLSLTAGLQAQQPAGAGFVDTSSSLPASTRTFSFSGTVPGQPDGALSVTFAIYADQQGSSPLWTETQVVQIAAERYNALLGSTSSTGLPAEIFAADQAHWLGVQVNGRETRYLLVSVPYAMKAVEAERLGGLLPSQFVTVQQLQSILQNAAGQPTGTATAPKSTTGVQTQAAATGSTPLPATDFTDNNTSEVLLVTQQGTGYAIHAITSSQAEAIFAENGSLGGTALHAFATNPSGQSIGIFGEVASADGIAAEFNNRAGGKILSLRSNGAEVASVDSTGQVQANNFVGNGSGLMNIPPSAINATPSTIANTVVARDGTASFSANQIFANVFFGSGSGLLNIPPSAINATPVNIANSVVARDGTGSFSANQIFGNTFFGNGSGLLNIPPSAINATATNIANSVVARDGTGSFSANQIFGNTFFGSGSGLFNIPPSAVGASDANLPSTIVARDTSGNFAANIVNANGLSAVSVGGGTAIQGSSSGVGIQASTQNGFALWAGASAQDSTGTVLLLSHASLGKLISGGVGTSTSLSNEAFSVDAQGDVSFNGFMMTPYETSGTWFANSLVKLTSSPGTFGSGTVAMTSPGDTSGVVGVITGLVAGSSRIHVAQSGEIFCNFDGPATAGHYVGISKTTAGNCTDIGATLPADGQQVVGRVVASFAPGATKILLFGPEQHVGTSGTLTSINTGAGLTGGPITSSGTIGIANNGVTNAMLQNSFLFVNSGNGLSGGGPVPLGGSLTLQNTGVLSFNGRTGSLLAAPGDYSFAQIAGVANASQLPNSTVYNNQSNTFSGDQTIQGSLNTTFDVNATGAVRANSVSGSSGNFTGTAAGNSVLTVLDNGTSGFAFSASSSTNPAALFMTSGPTVLMAGSVTGATTVLKTNGDLSLNGTATARAFSGDGSALTNVSAARIGTLAPADIATVPALSAETTARQSADTTLQTNINSETTARLAGDTALQSGINAETSARQSDVSNLQSNLNNVSAADAKLAASNTFTAGTQDFSAAGATLPVRAVLSANTPATCVAGKELLIKTDAADGQQLFICNATANGWNLVGDGAAGGVTAFNGRSGSVSASSGDYSFAQLSGSASAAQLPATLVYNNQANTFAGNQTVNGAVTAASFSGNGAGVSSVNAATLNGIPSNALAQLHAVNTFTSEQVLAASTATNPSLNMPAGSAPATPLAGDLWNTGAVLQYRDNASTTRSLVSTTQTGGLQLLKLTASITPANVANQTCSEQSFGVSGISTGDVLLGVSQPSTASPGNNIAIGGFRVSAANTVAIQFCNVSRNNNTPTSGVYTFALLR